jgi:hypothetical protein
MELMIAAQKGNARSLADVPAFIEAARALDAMGAFMGYITCAIPSRQSMRDWLARDTQLSEAERANELSRFDADDITYLERYSLLAGGRVFDDGANYTVLVLVNPTEEAAKANAARIERRLRELGASLRPRIDEMTAIEVRRDGTVVTVRIGAEIPHYSLVHWTELYWDQ